MTRQLQEAKARLQNLQDLLAAVSDFHNNGQPVPDQYLELLSQEAVKEESSVDLSKTDRQQSCSQRQSMQRERTPVRQQIQDKYVNDFIQIAFYNSDNSYTHIFRLSDDVK